MTQFKKLEDSSVAALRKGFSGDIILPEDPDYKTAANTFIHTGTPAMVVRPKTVSDVASAIAFAKDNELVLSVRAGGHSGVGFGTNAGGVVIDLIRMNDVAVLDKAKGLVKVGAGVTWEHVAKELQPHGLAISSGDTKTVGVGGLTLAGGIGWMVRKYGLALDNLVGAEIVTASGDVLHVSQDENTDLFWAIRGGGGNFGVVTNFEFTAREVGNVIAGKIQYKLDDVAGLVTTWRDCMRQAPVELTTMMLVMPSFAGNPPSAMVLCCYAGSDKNAAMKSLDVLLKRPDMTSEDLTEKPYGDVLEEAHPPQGVTIVVNNGFVKEMSDDLIQAIATFYGKEGAPALQIRNLGGAMNAVADDATAFAHRDSEALLISAAFVPVGASADMLEKAAEPWQALSKFTEGSYVNFFSVATEKEVASSYPAPTYKRLQDIKKEYDPENLFNQNYNIQPA